MGLLSHNLLPRAERPLPRTPFSRLSFVLFSASLTNWIGTTPKTFRADPLQRPGFRQIEGLRKQPAGVEGYAHRPSTEVRVRHAAGGQKAGEDKEGTPLAINVCHALTRE